MQRMQTQATAPGKGAHQRKRAEVRSTFGVRSGHDPVLADLLGGAAAIAVAIAAKQARWAAAAGMSPGYIAQWVRDGGPFGVVTRSLYALARTCQHLADAIVVHFEVTIDQARAESMTPQQIFDRYWQITHELEHDATAIEDKAVARRDLDAVYHADLAKGAVHKERATLYRLAQASQVDLNGARPF